MKSRTTTKFSYYFFGWITTLFTLVFSVPLFIYNDLIILAKLCGILSIVVLLIALVFWKQVSRKRNKIKNRVVLTVNELYWIDKNVVWFKLLTREEQKIIENRIGIFLAYVKIEVKDNDKNQLLYLALFDVLFFWEEIQPSCDGKLITLISSDDVVFEKRENGYLISHNYIKNSFSLFHFDSLKKPSILEISQRLKNEVKKI
jgi:hypothetical protein